ncbi:30S ribosome-binding factor RbfA [Calditrichota bacterium]
MKPYRINQVAALIQQEIAELIRTEIPVSAGYLITVTSAQVSVDGKYADLMVSIIGDEEVQKKALKHLQTNASRLRYIMSGRVKLRRTPELRFKLDKTAERAQRINEILNKSGIDFEAGETE